MSTHRLTIAQREMASALVEPALAFLTNSGSALGAAMVRYQWLDGPADDVLGALQGYQNEDGGFAGLEVDIKAPVSNPFAARLAMQALLSLRERPDAPLVTHLGAWITSAEDEDGDWHFAPEVYQHDLAPWFAGWTFPALNPSCCIAGLATELGILDVGAAHRVRVLFDRLSSLDEARTGEFYNVLPYVEYCERTNVTDRDAWLDAIAANIIRSHADGKYSDASHLLDHALGSGPLLANRIPADLVRSAVDELIGDAQEDGGWASPYDEGWRPWFTATNLMTLRRLRDGF